MKLNKYWLDEAKKALKLAWKHRDQHFWLFCPVCHQDLCSTDSFVQDKGKGIKNRVSYKCSRCGCKSIWNFDISIAPVLISDQRLSW